MQELINWIIDNHKNTNHFYDNHPYEYHLNKTVEEFESWKHLLPINLFSKNSVDITLNVIKIACYGHDLIEDTRTSYSECKKQLGPEVADIIYAVTNEKGRNRKEKANDKYYEGIKNTKGAVFVKLCDRLANVKYSKEQNSPMFKKYQEEHSNFLKQMGYQENNTYKLMFDYLTNLFKTN